MSRGLLWQSSAPLCPILTLARAFCTPPLAGIQPHAQPEPVQSTKDTDTDQNNGGSHGVVENVVVSSTDGHCARMKCRFATGKRWVRTSLQANRPSDRPTSGREHLAVPSVPAPAIASAGDSGCLDTNIARWSILESLHPANRTPENPVYIPGPRCGR